MAMSTSMGTASWSSTSRPLISLPTPSTPRSSRGAVTGSTGRPGRRTSPTSSRVWSSGSARLLANPENEALREWFEGFHEELRSSLNESVDGGRAIDMVAQHILTLPVFEALFEGYDFAERQPHRDGAGRTPWRLRRIRPRERDPRHGAVLRERAPPCARAWRTARPASRC